MTLVLRTYQSYVAPYLRVFCVPIALCGPLLYGQETHKRLFRPRAQDSVSQGAVQAVRRRHLTESEYLKLPECKIDIAEAVLIICKGIHPDTSVEKCLQEIDAIAVELRERLTKDMEPEEVVATLNKHIFVKRGFKSNPVSEGKHFLDTVIDEKGGNCVGLSCLYLSIAKRLDIPLFAVSAPEHMFVRYKRNDTQINIETTYNGKSLTDDEIIAWLNVSPTSVRQGVYLDILSKQNILGALLNSRGWIYDDRGDYKRALRDYNNSIRLYPKNPVAYNNRGAVYAITGLIAQALADYDTALSFDPNYAKAYCGRGNCYMIRGEYRRALVEFNKAIDLDPTQADAYNSLGLVHLQIGEYQHALKEFSRAISLKDRYSEAYFNRSLAQSLLGNKRDMLADLEKSINLAPGIKKHARSSPAFAKWRDDPSFKRLLRLSPKTEPGEASSLKEFPLLYLYFDNFSEIEQDARSGQLQIAIHDNDPRTRNYSVEGVITNEKLFLSLYRHELLRLKLDNGFEMFRSVEKDYWDRAVNPEKYSDELRSPNARIRKLREQIDVHVNAIRKRYGL